MSRQDKHYEDDDGRTIADMRLVERSPLLLPRRPKRTAPPEGETPDRPWEDRSVSRETRRGLIWGALSAALLIALAFILGLGLVIALIVLLGT